MSISIRNPLAEKLAREVADECNISMTQAIIEALEEKKQRLNRRDASEELRFIRLLQLAKDCSALPDLDKRSADEILAYDKDGIF